MFTFLSVLYIVVCIFLILVVLLQSGRGGGMGAAFGGASQTVFGGAGAGNFLTRLTAIGAALFMFLSLALAFLSSTSEKSLERAAETANARAKARGAIGAKEGAAKKKDEKPGAMSVSGSEGGKEGEAEAKGEEGSAPAVEPAEFQLKEPGSGKPKLNAPATPEDLP